MTKNCKVCSIEFAGHSNSVYCDFHKYGQHTNITDQEIVATHLLERERRQKASLEKDTLEQERRQAYRDRMDLHIAERGTPKEIRELQLQLAEIEIEINECEYKRRMLQSRQGLYGRKTQLLWDGVLGETYDKD